MVAYRSGRLQEHASLQRRGHEADERGRAGLRIADSILNDYDAAPSVALSDVGGTFVVATIETTSYGKEFDTSLPLITEFNQRNRIVATNDPGLRHRCRSALTVSNNYLLTDDVSYPSFFGSPPYGSVYGRLTVASLESSRDDADHGGGPEWRGPGMGSRQARPASRPAASRLLRGGCGVSPRIVEFLVGGRLQQADPRRSTASKETRS